MDKLVKREIDTKFVINTQFEKTTETQLTDEEFESKTLFKGNIRDNISTI